MGTVGGARPKTRRRAGKLGKRGRRLEAVESLHQAFPPLGLVGLDRAGRLEFDMLLEGAKVVVGAFKRLGGGHCGAEECSGGERRANKRRGSKSGSASRARCCRADV